NISMDELVPLIAKIAEVTPPTKVIPLALARIISRLQETKYKLLGGELPKLSSTAIAVMASGQFLDGTKANRELGFEAGTNVAEAIKRAVEWFKLNGYIKNG